MALGFSLCVRRRVVLWASHKSCRPYNAKLTELSEGSKTWGCETLNNEGLKFQACACKLHAERGFHTEKSEVWRVEDRRQERRDEREKREIRERRDHASPRPASSPRLAGARIASPRRLASSRLAGARVASQALASHRRIAPHRSPSSP